VVAKVQSPPDHPIEWCVESILSTLAIKCCVGLLSFHTMCIAFYRVQYNYWPGPQATSNGQVAHVCTRKELESFLGHNFKSCGLFWAGVFERAL